MQRDTKITVPARCYVRRCCLHSRSARPQNSGQPISTADENFEDYIESDIEWQGLPPPIPGKIEPPRALDVAAVVACSSAPIELDGRLAEVIADIVGATASTGLYTILYL